MWTKIGKAFEHFIGKPESPPPPTWAFRISAPCFKTALRSNDKTGRSVRGVIHEAGAAWHIDDASFILNIDVYYIT
jgi:hypothetical protein